MARARRPGAVRAAVATAALAAGAALAACGGQGGQALAQQACVHVDRSVSDYLRSTRPGTSADVAARLQSEADEQLRDALPIAAQANSADGSWNALMTTIAESSTVDEAHLIPSLRAQCGVANTQTNVNPQSPGGGVTTTTPENVNPQPASPAG